MVDKDRVKGAVNHAEGTVEEGVGTLKGDTKTQAEGKANKAAGKVQSSVGGAKDATRDATGPSSHIPSSLDADPFPPSAWPAFRPSTLRRATVVWPEVVDARAKHGHDGLGQWVSCNAGCRTRAGSWLPIPSLRKQC